MLNPAVQATEYEHQTPPLPGAQTNPLCASPFSTHPPGTGEAGDTPSGPHVTTAPLLCRHTCCSRVNLWNCTFRTVKRGPGAAPLPRWCSSRCTYAACASRWPLRFTHVTRRGPAVRIRRGRGGVDGLCTKRGPNIVTLEKLGFTLLQRRQQQQQAAPRSLPHGSFSGGCRGLSTPAPAVVLSF